MSVRVTFRLPSGAVRTVGHGALIGRLPSAAIHLDDGRVSEAHAMVSLRGRVVRLLALRGRFSVAGKKLADTPLREGLEIRLASDLALTVVAIELPDEVMAVRGDFGTRVLMGVTSLSAGPEVVIEHGWKPDAAAVVWPVGSSWRCKTGPLEVGSTLQIGSHAVELVRVPLEGPAATVRSAEFAVPLTIVARYDTVHFQRDGEKTVVLQGIIARILTELVQANTALSWEAMAKQVWDDPSRDSLRGRWDMQMLRFRKKLRSNGIRDDVLRSDGTGLIELVLGANDRVVDEA